MKKHFPFSQVYYNLENNLVININHEDYLLECVRKENFMPFFNVYVVEGILLRKLSQKNLDNTI